MHTKNEVNHLFQDICLNNSERSYDALYLLLSRRLIHFAASIVGSMVLAEEVVSDVFIMVWQKKRELQAVEQPMVYLYRCTRNRSINSLKQKKQFINYDEVDNQEMILVPDIEERMLNSEVKQLLERAVNKLPARCQLIFRLVRIEGLSYQEVASLLEISTKTVDAQLAIAIKRVANSIRLVMPAELARNFLHAH